jgi:uncharacterized coiled-coil DUF342 family protein
LAEEDIDRLEAESSSLFDKRDGLSKERDRHRKERDSLNESVKTLQDRANAEKEQRDTINKKVARLKSRLGTLRSRLDEKRGQVKGLDEKLKESRRRLNSRRRIQEELRDIEWTLSTTPTLEIKDKETQLVERANTLREEIHKHEELDSRDDMFVMSLADAKAIQLEIRETLDEMDELHKVSEGHHERMIALYRQADEERRRADEAHESFVEALKGIREVNREIDGVMKALRKHRAALREKDQARSFRRSKAMEEKKNELAEKARRKLEDGEKLTLEEMKLIYGEG